MPQVKKIINVMESYANQTDGYSLENYNNQYHLF